MHMKNKRNGLDINIKQESYLKAYIQKFHNIEFIKIIFFSIGFQILPVFVMFLIQLISNHKFSISEYIENFLVFVIVSCAANISELFTEKNLKINEPSTIVSIFILISVLCLSSVMYCLELIDSVTQSDKYCAVSFIFFIIIVYINLWRESKNKRLVENK